MLFFFSLSHPRRRGRERSDGIGIIQQQENKNKQSSGVLYPFLTVQEVVVIAGHATGITGVYVVVETVTAIVVAIASIVVIVVQAPPIVVRSTRVTVHATAFDGVGFYDGRDGEFDGARIDDTDDVTDSGRLDDAKEGMFDPVFSVHLHNLLVVVGALEEFHTRIQRTSVRSEQDSHRRHRGGEGHSVDGTALHHLGDLFADVPGDVLQTLIVRFDGGLDGVLQRLRVTDGDRVGVETGGCDDRREGAEVTVLQVDGHLVWSRIGPVPQFHVGSEGGPLRLHEDLDAIDVRVGEGPRLEGSTLDVFRREQVPVSRPGTIQRTGSWPDEGPTAFLGVPHGRTGDLRPRGRLEEWGTVSTQLSGTRDVTTVITRLEGCGGGWGRSTAGSSVLDDEGSSLCRQTQGKDKLTE